VAGVLGTGTPKATQRVFTDIVTTLQIMFGGLHDIPG